MAQGRGVCVRGAQCKHPEKEHPICCIGSAFPELVSLEREYPNGLPAPDPPKDGKNKPRSEKLSELVDGALSRARCLSGEHGQRCYFHASCEDERRDKGRSFDKNPLVVRKCKEPQAYTVRDPEHGEESAVPAHESQVYHRMFIKRGLDHLLCGPCWNAYARNSGLNLVAYPQADATMQQSREGRREQANASKKARTGHHYLDQIPCAVIRSTGRGPQLEITDLARERLEQHDPTWLEGIRPFVTRFQWATQGSPAPQQQRNSTFAHAPPAQRGAVPRAPPPLPGAVGAPHQHTAAHSTGLAPSAPGGSAGAVPQPPPPLPGAIGAPHQHTAAHSTGLAHLGLAGFTPPCQHTGVSVQPGPLLGAAIGAPDQLTAAHASGLISSGPSQDTSAVPRPPPPLPGAVGAPHQQTAAHATRLAPSAPGGSAGAVGAPHQHMATQATRLAPSAPGGFAGSAPLPAPFAGAASAPYQPTAHAAGLPPFGLAGLPTPSQVTGTFVLPGVPTQNVPPTLRLPRDEYAHAVGISYQGHNPLRKDCFKYGAPIPNFKQLRPVPATVPIHMDDEFFINEGIMGAMCGLVGDISRGVVCCLGPDWMEKLRRGERILEQVPPNWQFICLPFLSNLNRDGGDVFVPVWRMLVVDRKIKAVQIYCSMQRGPGLPARPPELRDPNTLSCLEGQLMDAGIEDAYLFDWKMHWAPTGCASDRLNSGVYIMSFLHLLCVRIPLRHWRAYCQGKENALRRQAGLSLLHKSVMQLSVVGG